ncbi:MAG: leucine-rich repeat protein, partial [Clostridia bacterium]|nr:leucine-rich repeat protein [Clostridia bacterium]
SDIEAENANITIPDSITTIEENAFYNSKFSSITFGSGLTSIGARAFLFCYATDTLPRFTFSEPDGWYVSRRKEATSGEEVVLTNPETNATYLIDTYKDYYWYRK